jgi:integrase/recombinase XerD
MIRKLYRERVPLRWKIIEKETIDEIIFRTTKVRNRLILELMARGGMRIGEVLKLRLCDLQDRKLVLREPKSGKEYEFVFIPQKVADRLREYAHAPGDRIFPPTARICKSGKMVVKLRRRHSYASRSGVPIDFKSHPPARKSFDNKVIQLRLIKILTTKPSGSSIHSIPIEISSLK